MKKLVENSTPLTYRLVINESMIKLKSSYLSSLVMKSSLFHLYFNNFRGMINNLYQSQQIYNYVNSVVNVFEVFFFHSCLTFSLSFRFISPH